MIRKIVGLRDLWAQQPLLALPEVSTLKPREPPPPPPPRSYRREVGYFFFLFFLFWVFGFAGLLAMIPTRTDAPGYAVVIPLGLLAGFLLKRRLSRPTLVTITLAG